MKHFLFTCLLCLLSGLLAAQTITVRGTVTDAEDGSPLPGAGVAVKGKSRGAIADADGAYSLETQQGDVLSVSYTGYLTREIRVGSENRIDIALSPDANQLEGVVIVALGLEAKKDALGYGTTVIKGAEVQETQRDNWLNSLAARVPGANIGSTSGLAGSSSSIILRGVSSLFGSNQPLIVVDGVQTDNSTFNQGGLVTDAPNRDNDYTNRAADLNPNDIETITVLKGPEAAALYGAVAGNGAIIITTKKGSQGDGRITYDNAFRFEDVYRIPETQRVYARGSSGNADETLVTRSTFGPRYGEGQQLYNNVENFFRQGFSQRHNLVVEGGTERITYRWSNSFQDYKGVVPSNGLRNITSTLSGSVRVHKYLRVETRLTYTNSVNDKVYKGVNGVLLNLLSWPADDNMADYENPDGTRRRLLANINTAEADNPLFNAARNLNQDKTDRFRGAVSMLFSPAKWLDIKATYGPDRYTQTGVEVLHPESNGGFIPRGQIENYALTSRLNDLNGTIRAHKELGKFSGSLMVGSQVVSSRSDILGTRGQRFFDPSFYNINNTDPLTRNAKSTITRRNLIGVFGQAEFGFNEMAYLTLTARNDWTSTLPVNNRSYFYPSASLSILAHKFLPKNKILTYLKLRGSYAQVGKDAPAHRTLSTLNSRTTTGGGYSYGFFGGNANLIPEQNVSREVGLEARFLNDRISLEGSYFFRTSFEQISPPRTSYGTGFVLSYINSGILSNWGYEAVLGLTPIRKRGFNWDINFNFTKLDSRADKLPLDLPEFYVSDTWLFENVRNSMFKGGSLTTFGATNYLRNTRGDILINPNTGLPEVDGNFTYAGDRNPDFSLGVGNTLSFKGLSFNFLLDIRKGGDVFNGNELYLFRRGLSNLLIDDREKPYVFKGVLRDGRENSDSPTPNNISIVPQYNNTFFGAFSPADFIERDINWIRLRDVTISYELPVRLVSQSGVFTAAKLFLTGTDLFMVTNYSGADPAVNGNSAATPGSGAAGFDYGSLANPRAISFGLRVTL